MAKMATMQVDLMNVEPVKQMAAVLELYVEVFGEWTPAQLAHLNECLMCSGPFDPCSELPKREGG